MKLGQALKRRPCSTSACVGQFMDRDETMARGLPRGNCCLGFSPSNPCLGAIGSTPRCFLDLHVLLRSDEDVPHLGDIILHQMLVE